MQTQKNNGNLIWIAMVVVAVVASVIIRLLPYTTDVTLYNFSPIAALALFGGALIRDKRLAVIMAVGGLFVSDLLIEIIKPGFGFYTDMAFVYISFLMIMGIGMFTGKKLNLPRVAAASLASSVLFFLVTNFGVWAVNGYYPHTVAGLLSCYELALPFFRATFAGDLIFSTLFFGSYFAVKHSFRLQRA